MVHNAISTTSNHHAAARCSNAWTLNLSENNGDSSVDESLLIFDSLDGISFFEFV